MARPRNEKKAPRGSRPKHSIQNTHKVYCERCECSYNVPNNRNGDQWLNYHWRHFNCLQKKLIRQQEEDSSVVRSKTPSSTVEDFYRFCLLSTIRNDGTCTTSQRSLHSMGRSICNCRRSFPCCRSGIEELRLF